MTEATFQGAKPKWKEPAPPTPEELKIQKLNDVRKELAYRDRNFATSLCEQFTKKGFLSDAQWVWVDTLIGRAAAPKPTQEEQPSGFTSTVAMIDKAATELQFVRFDFTVGELRMRLTRNGPSSRYPGAVAIVSQHKSFGDRIYYGRIERDGVLHLSKQGGELAGLVDALRAVEANPGKVASDYGAKFSQCGFCGQDLTHPSSVKHGYGPICAGHYGLPWGD